MPLWISPQMHTHTFAISSSHTVYDFYSNVKYSYYRYWPGFCQYLLLFNNHRFALVLLVNSVKAVMHDHYLIVTVICPWSWSMILLFCFFILNQLKHFYIKKPKIISRPHLTSVLNLSPGFLEYMGIRSVQVNRSTHKKDCGQISNFPSSTRIV